MFRQCSLLRPSFWISGEKNVELAFSLHLGKKMVGIKTAEQTAATRGQSSEGCRRHLTLAGRRRNLSGLPALILHFLSIFSFL